MEIKKRIPVRATFRPNAPNHLFVKVDYSQLEDRIGKMYCQTPDMVELANRKPWDYDAHTDNAKKIFQKDAIAKEERELGKSTVHGYWRGIGPNKLAETILKKTKGKLIVNKAKCQWLLGQFEKAMPQIKHVYMPWAREQAETGKCVNSFGRIFPTQFYKPFNEEFLRKVYSYYPQSDGCDMMMRLGVKPGDAWLKARYGYGLSMQVHDEIIASVPYEDVWEYYTFIKTHMEAPTTICGAILVCTATAKISTTLYSGVEFEKFETRPNFYTKLNQYLEKEQWHGKV